MPSPLLILIFVLVFLLLIFGLYAMICSRNFARELRYLNMEIGRTTGDEQKFWKNERRNLWLSFFGILRK